MLYRFDPHSQALDALVPVEASSAGVLEKQIELAVANKPEAIFETGAAGDPVLVLRTSVPGRKMPDIIALDAEGRLVLVECKRGWADRDALAQLLDYAADYTADPLTMLERDWSYGRGKGTGQSLIEAFRAFAEDAGFEETTLGRDQVLVVVASGEAPGFRKIVRYLEGRGVPVYLIPVKLYRRDGGEMYLDVDPINIAPVREKAAGDTGRAWMINTDETHSSGAWKRFLKNGVAAIWGYPTYGATLDQGARAGDTIYAYRNGHGIIARGTIADDDVRPVAESTAASVFPECVDGNEWHLPVDWTPLPGGGAVSNREVREGAGAGLPVRNTFCRLWNSDVRDYLASRWTPAEP